MHDLRGWAEAAGNEEAWTMGALIAMKYPTKLFIGMADHTYVQCGNGGRAWGCWGGKTGGGPLRSGDGSTLRADTIAQPDERAGVTCYLVNGVCHQAANRVLYPAGITVRGARGYDVSELLFGTYGRPRGLLGRCLAPFNRFGSVTGDLPECLAAPRIAGIEATARPTPGPFEARERHYVSRVIEAYDKVAARPLATDAEEFGDLLDFSLHLFLLKVDFNLAEAAGAVERRRLMELRRQVEIARAPLEVSFGNRELAAGEFADRVEGVFARFQDLAADALPPTHYKALFGQDPGDVIRLADPDIVAKAYGER